MERKKYTNLYEAEKTISNRFVKIPRNSYWQSEGYNVTGSKSVSKAPSSGYHLFWASSLIRW